MKNSKKRRPLKSPRNHGGDMEKVGLVGSTPNIGNTSLQIPSSTIRALTFGSSAAFAVKNNDAEAVLYLENNTAQLGSADPSAGTDTLNLFAKTGSLVPACRSHSYYRRVLHRQHRRRG